MHNACMMILDVSSSLYSNCFLVVVSFFSHRHINLFRLISHDHIELMFQFLIEVLFQFPY